MDKDLEGKVGKLFIGIFAIAGLMMVVNIFGLLLAFPIKWTWNFAMTAIFGLPSITWGKAWCLNFLASILLKSNWKTETKK